MNRFAILIGALALAAIGLAQTPIVKKIELAREGPSQKEIVVKSFAPGDGPIHSLLHFDALKAPYIFTGTLIAVKAGNVEKFKVATVNLSARAGSNLVDFRFSLPRLWPAGSYKVEIRMNGKPFREIPFLIK